MQIDTDSAFKQPQTMLPVLSNSDIAAREEEKRRVAEGADSPRVKDDVLDHCRNAYETARDARDSSGQTERMLDAGRRRDSQYGDDVLAKLRTRGLSEIFLPVTETKCLNAEAWLQDIENTVGERAWMLEPTPDPDMQAGVQQRAQQAAYMAVMERLQAGEAVAETDRQDIEDEIAEQIRADIDKQARDRAGLMRDAIEDDLAEANWREQKKVFHSYAITYGTAFLKGPMVRMRECLTWAESAPVVTARVALETDVPHPLDIFPSPNSVHVNDGYIVERMRVSREKLNEWKDLPGYDKDAIDALLEQHPQGVQDVQSEDSSRAATEARASGQESAEGDFVAFEYWGGLDGAWLNERGIECDAGKRFAVQVVWCADKVLKLMVNPDPRGKRPYHKGVWKVRPNAFWGKGVPELIKSAQDIANAAGRALVTNMGVASGPQVDVDLEQIDPDTPLTTMYPLKMWKTRSKPGHNRRALEFYQPDDRSDRLIAIYDRAGQMADDASGVPAYAYGSDEVSGAGQTASGLSMLLNAAARGMKDAMWQLDLAKASYIERHFVWKMLYDENAEIKGDAKVVTKGTMGILLQELRQAQIREFLDRLMTPQGVEIFGPESIVKVMHEYGELLQLDHENLLPSADEVLERLRKQAEAQQQAAAADAAARMQAEQAKAEAAGAKARVDEGRLMIERAKAVSDIEGRMAERAGGGGAGAGFGVGARGGGGGRGAGGLRRPAA